MTSPNPVPPHRPGLFRRSFHRWREILLIWLIGSAAACAAVYVNVKPTYQASSLLRLEPLVSDLYGVRGGNESFDAFLQTQVQLVTSPNVLTAAGADPKAAALPRIQAAVDVVQELRKVISVNSIGGTYLIQIAMASPNNYECAVLVNAVADAFLEANNGWSNGMTEAQIKTLETYKVDLKNQTDELERQWGELVAKGDVDDQLVRDAREKTRPFKPEGSGVARGRITVEEYKQIRQDLFQVELELAQAEAWLVEVKRFAREAPATPDPAKLDQQVERRIKDDPAVVELVAKLKDAKEKLDDVRRTATNPGEPAELAAQKHLDELTAAHDQAQQARSRIDREQLEAHRADSDLELREADHRVRFLKVRQATLIQASERLEVGHKRQATDSVKISLIQDERQSLKSMQEAVHRRLEQLRFEAKGEERIRRVAKAEPPGKPIADRRPFLLTVIPVAMLFIALVPFLVFEAWTGPPGHPISVGEWPVEP